MIVYVETNFVMELALRQEQFDAANEILELARFGSIDLRIPAFALIEPKWSIDGRDKTRKTLLKGMEREVGEIQRSRSRNPIVESVQAAMDRLGILQAEDQDAYDFTVSDILTIARILPVDHTVLTLAPHTQAQFDLSLFDAVMLTAVLEDLKPQDPARRKILVTTDRNDFNKPGNKRALKKLGCSLLFTFDNALRVLRRFVEVPIRIEGS